jgi:two-component system response regulator AtoC
MADQIKARILVVDDEPNIAEVVRSTLISTGYEVEATSKPTDAEALLEQQEFDLVLTDLKMDPVDGLEILRRTKEKDPHVPVIIITAFATVETAIEAMKAGAFDYILKPFKLSELKIVVRKALEYRATLVENDQLKEMLKTKFDMSNIIGKSPAMQPIFECIRKVATSNATILVTGESGTGKELVAKAIYMNSNRHERPFISINCGALPETLLESELFGYVKGAFTGANADKKGLFQAADGGTIFLDEIGLTTPAMQMRLLRVLQEREFRRVGDTRDIKVDVRVIAATNENLSEKVKSSKFREDLYYRLSVIPVHLPPLRERRSDIPLLIQHFLQRAEARMGKKYRVEKRFLDTLIQYSWPGNIRELENVIERGVALAEGTTLNVDDMPDNILDFKPEESDTTPRELRAVVEESERRHIVRVIKETDGNKKLAARILGIDLATLYRKMDRLDMSTKA